MLDTRAGQSTIDGAQLGAGPVAAGTSLVLPIAGRGGVPTDATSVVLNVTADGAQGPGYVTVYACDAPQPVASNVNFVATTPSAERGHHQVVGNRHRLPVRRGQLRQPHRRRQRLFRVIHRLVAALALVAIGISVPVAPTPAHAARWSDGPCTDNVGITVVIDFQELGGGVNVRCAPGPVTTGLDALDKAGISWEGTRRFPGFVCRIAGKPGTGSRVVRHHAPGDRLLVVLDRPSGWHRGATAPSARATAPRLPAPVEGWSFALDQVSVDIPPPGFDPPAADPRRAAESI